MELAIPFIALSGLYIINRQQERREGLKRKITTENFSNNALPNVSPIPPNYPTLNTSNINNGPLENDLNYYDTPNPATDTYLNQSLYEKKENMGMNVGMNIPNVYSLTGDYMKTSEFKHNNMVPFYGGKIKGQMYNEATESQLDNMVGAGSQIIRKVEQAPLFEPKNDVQYPYGAPDMSEFFASREVVSKLKNNVKPFESVIVGPGLNQGFESQGSGGFNSGMEQRDMWLPKTVDELRVDTNPKMSYILDNSYFYISIFSSICFVASEILPFLPSKSNGIFHSVILFLANYNKYVSKKSEKLEDNNKKEEKVLEKIETIEKDQQEQNTKNEIILKELNEINSKIDKLLKTGASLHDV